MFLSPTKTEIYLKTKYNMKQTRSYSPLGC